MICAHTPKLGDAILAIIGLAGLITAATAEPGTARGRQDATRDEAAQDRPAGPPLMAIVSLEEQRITIYDASGPILHAPVSSGRTGYETPVGVYSVLQKEAEHYSNRYDDASMPFMQRITWSGIALHAGLLPGYPASHGCIRMPYEFAEHLFGLTKVGMRVIVARNDVVPAAISHPLFMKSDRSLALQSIVATKLAEADAAQKKAEQTRPMVRQKVSEKARAQRALRMAEIAKTRAETRATEAEYALRAASAPEAIAQAEATKSEAAAKLAGAQAQLETARMEVQPKIDEAARAIEEAKAALAVRVAAMDAVQEAERKLAPISIFVSMKTQRLYVRQAFEHELESPVTIRDPDKAIGTHIFTAMGYDSGGGDARWSVVTLSGKRSDEPGSNERRYQTGKADRGADPVATDLAAAAAALDRITIPPEIMDRLSQSVSPGSSLIVSDEELSTETAEATDFVVLISGEPQGGLKLRRRDPELFGDHSPFRRAPFAFYRWR
jgi:hypothetical protein